MKHYFTQTSTRCRLQTFVFSVMVLALIMASFSKAQAQVVNGTFTGSLAGWTVTGGAGLGGPWAYSSGSGNPSGGGVFTLADDASTTIYQDLTGVVPGSAFTFDSRFFVNPGSDAGTLTATYAGFTLGTRNSRPGGVPGTNSWATTSGIIPLAAPTSGRIQFTFTPGAGSTSNDDAFIDNVKITCTAPTFTAQPTSSPVCVGGTTTYSVSASGTTSFQWQFLNGSTWTNLPEGAFGGDGTFTGTTSATLTYSNAALGRNGMQLRVLAGPATCQATSSAISMSVVAPPAFTVQPASTPVCIGGTKVYSASASGATGFQWQFLNGSTWTNLPEGAFGGDGTFTGTTSANLTYSNAALGRNGMQLRLIASSASCSTISSAIAMSVVAGPAFTVQPASQSVCVNSTKTFSAAASGATSYQWQFLSGSTWNNLTNGTFGDATFSGVSTANFTIAPTGGNYNGLPIRVLASNGTCFTASNTATITVSAAPAFSVQPVNKTICPNGSTTFTATAAGSTYSWEYSPDGGVNWGSAAANYSDANGSWSNGTTNTLTVTTTGVWTNFRFRVVATNASGCNTTSSVATMTVSTPPTITTQPINKSVCLNGTTTFTVTASGATGYQWQYSVDNGVNWNNSGDGTFPDATVSGSTSTTLTYSNIAASLNGRRFRVIPFNAAGCNTVSNGTATLTVAAPPTITTQPANKTVCVNASTTFSVTPTGAGPFTYQWQYSGDNGANWILTPVDGNYPPDGSYSGVTTATLTINPTNINWNGLQWRVVVTNAAGCALTSSAATLTVNNCSTGAQLSVKVLLEAAMTNATTMNALQTTDFGSLLPQNSPYAGASATYANFAAAGNVSDWILVQIVSAADINTVLQQKSVLLRSDGTMLDVNGTATTVAFNAQTNVRIGIRHRNHLAVFSNPIASFTGAVSYDFTTGANKALTPAGYPAQEVSPFGGTFAMWSSDVITDAFIDGSDLSEVQADFDNAVFGSYLSTDVNLDGYIDGIDQSFTQKNFELAIYGNF